MASNWEDVEGADALMARRAFADRQRPEGMTPDRFEQILQNAVRSAWLLASGRPRVAIICPTMDEFTALRGALAGCDLVPPADSRSAGYRPVAMNYWISDVPMADDQGAPTGGREAVVCAHVARQGLTSMAFAVTALLHAFPTVNHVILCGVAAGVPTPPPDRAKWESTQPPGTNLNAAWKRLRLKHGETDVRLGDIVVGESAVQFDFGKSTMLGFQPRGELARGCEHMKTVNDRLFERMKSEGLRPWDDYIDRAINVVAKRRNQALKRPTVDELHHHRLERHAESGDLMIVKAAEPLERGVPAHRVPKGRPNVFRCKIGSSDMVMKDSSQRDKIGLIHGVGAVEMEGTAALEAAAAVGNVRALIVRGICDYADPDKNDDWWMYAACVAAAYSRCIVERLHLQLDSGI